jgi:multisubunit Na+/H+ antiporter MnhE subunit
MSNFLIIFLLTIFWISSSATFNSFLIICGLISLIATFLIYRFMIKITKEQLDSNFNFFDRLPKSPKMIIFIFDILVEICKSSISLMKNIIFGKEICCNFIEIDLCNVKKDSLLVLFIAHSLTTSPGSIAVFEDEKKKLIVHCLYKDAEDYIREMNNYEDFIKFMEK